MNRYAVIGALLASAAAGTNFTFTLDAPPKDVPYYVEWVPYYNSRPATRWERFRMGCFYFFSAHGMPVLARPFAAPLEKHYIPSTEIKQ